jgi:predicted dehydrogenase
VIREGIIGEPQMWLSGGIGNVWSPNKMSARTAWRHQKLAAGGGGAIDVGVHLFHQVRYLLGPVEEVSAYVRTFEPERVNLNEQGEEVARVANEVEDVFFANIRLANGAVGTAFWSWAGHGEPAGLAASPVIYGSCGCIKGDTVILDDGFRAEVRRLFESRAPIEVRRSYFPLGVRDAFGLEMHSFLRAVRDGQPMETSGEEGLLDLATAYAILESATANCSVKVADVLAGTVSAYQAQIDDYYGQ